MKLTTNYSLKKPEGSDVVNIDDFNYNADIIDNAIQEIKNTSSTNKTNISNLTTKVNNGQTYRLTNENGDYQEYSGSINSLTNGGFYASKSTSGAPSSESSWWYYEVIVHPHRGNILQKAMTIDGTISYYRWGNVNGSWDAWRNEKSAYKDTVTLYNGWASDAMHPTVYKYGNIVYLSLSIKNGSTAVNTKIGSVPNGYKPRRLTIVHGMVCDSSYTPHNGSIVIDTNGNISINDFRGYNTRNLFNAFWEV